MEKFIALLYRQITHRCRSKKRPKYFGLKYCSKEEFIAFAKSPKFEELYTAWLASGKQRKLVPTADRVVPKLGYVVSNLVWRTLADNSRRATHSLRVKKSGLPQGVRFYGVNYVARIRKNYTTINLGLFPTAELAHKAYLKALEEQNRNKE